MSTATTAWQAREIERGTTRSCNPQTEFRAGFAAANCSEIPNGSDEVTRLRFIGEELRAERDKAIAERDASRPVNAEFLAARGDVAAHDREVAATALEEAAAWIESTVMPMRDAQTRLRKYAAYQRADRGDS